MLSRKIEQDILGWLNHSNKALMISGARQVGKTFIIRSIFKKNKIDYVEFNLIEEPRALKVLKSYSTVDDLILKLSLLSNKKLTPRKTFIFLDEIQEFPEIITKIKFLTEDGRFRFVLSGSLLGIELRNLKSAPVGYLQTLTMYPLDFEEFLQIFNIPEEIFSKLKSSYDTKLPLDKTIHEKFLEIFNLYMIIGGMPAAVKIFKQTNNIDKVIIEHNAIIEEYKRDFTKYEEEDRKLIITKIFEMIPAELNEKNKRFKITNIDKNARIDRIEDSFTWLTKAGVALAAYNTTEPILPLVLNKKSSLFKLFLSDVGLLTTMFGKATKLQIVNNETNINKGALFENVIIQELFAHGYVAFYYSNKKLGEVDFIIEHNGKILPIEVKSGKNYQKHSALNNIIRTENYKLENAFVFSSSNTSVHGKIVYYPIYMIMFLQEDELGQPIIPLSHYTF